MKIYTKTGDRGQTSLFGGRKVSKSDLRIDSYGTVDELNSHIGLVRDVCLEEMDKNFLYDIQKELFNIGAILATDPDSKMKNSLPTLDEKSILAMEKEIDRLNLDLEALKYFILPGGHIHISYCHIARCVCRRAERITVALSEITEVNELIIKYLNRLSDYLFTLARKLARDLNVEEIRWIS